MFFKKEGGGFAVRKKNINFAARKPALRVWVFRCL